MTEEKKQLKRRWLGTGIVLVTIAVFFLVRSMTRDRLQVHAAQALHVPLVSTISTNGRVEPEMNYELHAPISGLVKAVYAQPGDQVAAPTSSLSSPTSSRTRHDCSNFASG